MIPEIATLKQSFYNADNRKLLMTLYRRALMRSDIMTIWGSSDFYNELCTLQLGDTMTSFFSAKITKSIKVPHPPMRISKLLVTNRSALKAGSIIQEGTFPNRLARISKDYGAMIEIEYFPAWLRGTNITLETQMLASRPALPEEIDNPSQLVSLTPING